MAMPQQCHALRGCNDRNFQARSNLGDCSMLARTTVAAMLALGLAGCGTTVEDRGLSGAGIGAAAGSIIGAITGFGPWQGALLGAGVGGAAGALTDSRDVDLGRPVWRQGESTRPAPAARPSAAPVSVSASTTSVVK